MTDVVDMQSGIRTGCRPDEWVIARIADHQHGVVTRRQLREAGFHESSIRRRIAAGRLHPLHAGVYAVGRRGVSRHGRWLAAVLACGDGALACGQTAAAVWGVLLTAGSRVDVTARTRRGRPGIVLHGHRHLHPEDRRV
jgi:hypothetical protein